MPPRDQAAEALEAAARHTRGARRCGFSGEGEMYLFASILNEMFSSYVSLNSFTQLTVTGANTRVVYKWEPKSGNLTLI